MILRAHCLFDLQLFHCDIHLAQLNNCKSNKQCARTIVVVTSIYISGEKATLKNKIIKHKVIL